MEKIGEIDEDSQYKCTVSEIREETNRRTRMAKTQKFDVLQPWNCSMVSKQASNTERTHAKLVLYLQPLGFETTLTEFVQ